jgi:hypothetical protein
MLLKFRAFLSIYIIKTHPNLDMRVIKHNATLPEEPAVSSQSVELIGTQDTAEGQRTIYKDDLTKWRNGIEITPSIDQAPLCTFLRTLLGSSFCYGY